ncbi:serine/threonine-protein kinase [Nocardia camponoti]|uniref:non-specific serine/threonine protein kinase n=1 Tax=Nocardia camponoti TaxID=1616106 RepID=A0A917V4A7_9NOCA|nr:serine/threonine-protein kinase [Nocardia camponoti]GGK37753.1 hypothetical protein GCM10011591_06730 [Nocardia camponoti]
MTSDRLIAGRYRLTEPIGTGAMGVVWRATDVRLRRTVAVKQVLLAPGLTGTQALEAKLRAMREGRIAARLHHPNAITVFDVAEEDGQPWLVMEYLNAPSLAVKIAGGHRLPPIEVAGIGAQAAAALSAAHNAGIMHRDVKPANLLVADDGTVKLTDFGISHATGDVTVTATGFLAGTPAYLAPEIARGDSPNAAADVFALGSTLYAAVEGQPPFGEGDNPLAVLHAVARGKVPEPKHAGPLGPVLMWLLTADPETRPTMAEARLALEDVAAGRVPKLPTPATMIMPVSESATELIAVPKSNARTAAGRLGDSLSRLRSAASAISGGGSAGPPSAAARALAVGAAASARAADASANANNSANVVPVHDDSAAATDGVTTALPQQNSPNPKAAGRGNNRATLLLAAAVAAFTVVLAVLVVTRDRDKSTDEQALVPSTPITVTTMIDGEVSTVVLAPEQQTVTVPVTVSGSPAPTGTARPTSSAAPTTSGKPTSTPKPTSATTTITTTAFGPPTPDRISQFISGYYSMLPGNIGGAWAQLSPAYQSQTGGFNQYSAWWSTVRSVTVGSVTPTGPDRATVTLTYALSNGTVTSENRWIQVTGDSAHLQIAGSGV